MKLRSGTIALVLLMAVEALTASAQKPITTGGDFRGARWGQSPLEVEALEAKAPFRRDKQLVIFHDEFQGTPTEVVYLFLNDKLVMGFTHLLLKHEDLNLYFTDYEQVKDALARSLGAPAVENWQLSLPELEGDKSLWPEALGFGLIKVEAGWIYRDTGIAVRLSGGNFQAHLMTVHFKVDDMNAGRAAFKDYYAQNIGVPNKYFQD
jgi:hypothetical protein